MPSSNGTAVRSRQAETLRGLAAAESRQVDVGGSTAKATTCTYDSLCSRSLRQSPLLQRRPQQPDSVANVMLHH